MLYTKLKESKLWSHLPTLSAPLCCSKSCDRIVGPEFTVNVKKTAADFCRKSATSKGLRDQVPMCPADFTVLTCWINKENRLPATLFTFMVLLKRKNRAKCLFMKSALYFLMWIIFWVGGSFFEPLLLELNSPFLTSLTYQTHGPQWKWERKRRRKRKNLASLRSCLFLWQYEACAGTCDDLTKAYPPPPPGCSQRLPPHWSRCSQRCPVTAGLRNQPRWWHGILLIPAEEHTVPRDWHFIMLQQMTADPISITSFCICCSSEVLH